MWKPPERIKYEPHPGHWPGAAEAKGSRWFSPVAVGPVTLEIRDASGEVVQEWSSADTVAAPVPAKMRTAPHPTCLSGGVRPRHARRNSRRRWGT